MNRPNIDHQSSSLIFTPTPPNNYTYSYSSIEPASLTHTENSALSDSTLVFSPKPSCPRGEGKKYYEIWQGRREDMWKGLLSKREGGGRVWDLDVLKCGDLEVWSGWLMRERGIWYRILDRCSGFGFECEHLLLGDIFVEGCVFPLEWRFEV